MSTAPKRPRAEMEKLAEELRQLLEPACLKIEVAGSIRRQCAQVGDIELVAIPKIEAVQTESAPDLFGEKKYGVVPYNLLWKSLNAFFKGKYRLNGEKHKSFYWPMSGADGDLVQVDLFTASLANWGWIYLIRTGSADFSHHVAKALNKRGYTSKDGAIHRGELKYVDNQYNLVAFGNPISTPAEQDVFDLAQIPYREPKVRF